MTLSEPKKFYTRFLDGHKGKLHFAAHSHHFWPDVSRDAHLEYWDDCAKTSDDKWHKVFGKVIPEAQEHIARMLHLKDPKQISFAPNTHELTTRILSLFLGRSSLKVLTTAHEFHSWGRQMLRLSELPDVTIKKVTGDLLHKKAAFIAELKTELAQNYDLFFISQVFFDSGLALTDEDLNELSSACPDSTIMVVDGYHAFGALPTDLSKLEGKIFYLAGGYKYAQAGEGVGFLVVPQGHWRPAYTGWFAEYEDLALPTGAKVGYSQDGMAFMGATQDPSGLYRFNRVWGNFSQEKWNVPDIHSHVKTLQLLVIQGLKAKFLTHWKLKPLYHPELPWHGHFLTFEAPTAEDAQKLQETLKQLQVLIDRRGNRLRFGFGLYQNAKDVEALLDCLEKLT